MIRKILTLSTGLGIFIQVTVAQQLNNAEMDSLFDALAQKNKAMMSITIAKSGKVLYTKATGYSELNKTGKIPATTQTRYRIGSISKMFTAVMVFQLIEEGKLQINTSLATFFADLPNADKITIGAMLNHSSGLHNFTADSSYASIMERKVTHEEMLNRFKTTKPDFEPGAKHQYSNTNFILLGYIIEKLDHKTYQNALRTRILNKIDLNETYYGGKINPANKEAYAYTWKENWQPSTETDMTVPGGAGALVSTPTELVKFIQALFNAKLLSESSLNQMKTIKDGYGMAMFSFPFNNKTGYGHNGGIDGFQSQAVYFPEDKLAVAYVANGVNTSLNSVMIGVLSIIFNLPYTIPSYETVTLKPEILEKYTGVYTTPALPLKITITLKDGGLIAQATGQSSFPLEAIDNQQFKFDPANISFTFDPMKNQMTMKQGGATYIFIKE